MDGDTLQRIGATNLPNFMTSINSANNVKLQFVQLNINSGSECAGKWVSKQQADVLPRHSYILRVPLLELALIGSSFVVCHQLTMAWCCLPLEINVSRLNLMLGFLLCILFGVMMYFI
jgi:hypothetical protein